MDTSLKKSMASTNKITKMETVVNTVAKALSIKPFSIDFSINFPKMP
jgi:hypothetical protein